MLAPFVGRQKVTVVPIQKNKKTNKKKLTEKGRKQDRKNAKFVSCVCACKKERERERENERTVCLSKKNYN